ncbi:AAA family ATPase [Desertibaculum subflavum]|uniref:AAA family ATPase n=1 Tax=Desertibaculum subflavum TaxID=2268458 RepID=UPI000E65F469
MPFARASIRLAAWSAACLALQAAPAQSAEISVTFTAHHAYLGSDDGFFAGILLTGQDLFRVDLGQVVGKYIGETEKNLGLLFNRIGTGDVTLLFDEADALFGKRTDVKDANDRFADDFIVLDLAAGTWHGQVALGPDDGVREDGVYELAGRFADLTVTPVAAPSGLAALATALVLLGAATTGGRRRAAA